MKLAAYLAERKMGPSAFGRLINVKPWAVSRWLKPRNDKLFNMPSIENMQAIAIATDGLVTANDFYGIEGGEGPCGIPQEAAE